MNFNWKAFNPKLGLLMVIAIVLGFILANWVGLAGPIISLSALLTAMATVGVHGSLRDRMINILGQSSVLGYVGTPDDHQTRSTPDKDQPDKPGQRCLSSAGFLRNAPQLIARP